MKARVTFAAALLSASVLLSASALPTAPAFAKDTNAVAMMQLFSLSCLANAAAADKVRDFAAEKRLIPVADPTIIEALFADPTMPGEAWELPSPTDKYFVLSMQENPGVCSVGAEAVDSAELVSNFKKLQTSFEKSGLMAKVERDETFKTKDGERRIIYMSTRSSEFGNYFYALQVGTGGGSPFGATIRISPFTE